MKRRGYGKGRGMGYKNLMPMDSYVHSMSAKGVSINMVNEPSKGMMRIYDQEKGVVGNIIKESDKVIYEGNNYFINENLSYTTQGTQVSYDVVKKSKIPFVQQINKATGTVNEKFLNLPQAKKLLIEVEKINKLGAKGGWNKMGNMSIYVGQHTSYWTMPSGRNTYGKTQSGKRVKQPLDYVISMSGEKGDSGGAGSYSISWFKGFTSEPNPLFAVTPTFDMNIAGKEHKLKKTFYGRISDVNKVRNVISKMIQETGKLPSEKEVVSKVISMEKEFQDYTVSNWIYDYKHKGE